MKTIILGRDPKKTEKGLGRVNRGGGKASPRVLHECPLWVSGLQPIRTSEELTECTQLSTSGDGGKRGIRTASAHPHWPRFGPGGVHPSHFRLTRAADGEQVPGVSSKVKAGRKASKQKAGAQQHTWTRCYRGTPAQKVAIAMGKEKTTGQEEAK